VRTVVLLLLIARVASAHQSSTKYLDVTIIGDRAELALRFVPSDVTEPMKLRPDAKPTAKAAAASPGVPAYVERWVAVRGCTAGNGTGSVAEDGFVAVTWTVTCPDAIHELVLDFTPFFSLDSKMEMFVHPQGSDDSLRVTAAAPSLTLTLDGSPFIDGALDALAIERLAFVVLIVLVGALAPRYLRATAILLATYSLATLIGAVTGVTGVALDPMLGDALVAATILYAGVEVISRPDWRWRTATFAAFGVVHGIVHNSRGASISSILIFNLAASLVTGVLAFAVLLPLIRVAVARIGQRPVVVAVAALVTTSSIVWFVERAFGT
jgi:hydrogenase/urease accessory protein HupE